jgi:hypothetical protein
MTDAKAALETLDQKAGRVHTRADMRRIYEKSLSNPAAILEDDLTIVRYFHGEQEAAKYAARRANAIAGPPADPAPTVPTKTARSLRKYFESYSEGLGVALKPIFQRYQAEIATLKAEIEKLKARPLQKWAGIHVKGQQYAEASIVTHGGGLWVSTTTTTTNPGESGSEWRLIVKKGHA